MYLHPVRRIYDYHLGEFLRGWLKDGKFGISPDEHLAITDAEVTTALRLAAREGQEAALRIVDRRHFKAIWKHNRRDVQANPDAGSMIFKAACKEFGDDSVRRPPPYTSQNAISDFPVQLRDGRVASAHELSEVLQRLPAITSDVVYVDPRLRDQARKWLDGQLETILQQSPEEGEE